MPPQSGADDTHHAGNATDADPGALSWAIHDLAVAIAEADVIAAAHLGVTAGDYLALKHLLMAGDTLGPVDLGRLLGMSSGSATTLVHRLTRAGHVTRTEHPTDRRRRVVTVTPATREHLLAALRPIAAAIDAAATHLTPAERRATLRFLADVTASRRRRPQQPDVRRPPVPGRKGGAPADVHRNHTG